MFRKLGGGAFQGFGCVIYGIAGLVGVAINISVVMEATGRGVNGYLQNAHQGVGVMFLRCRAFQIRLTVRQNAHQGVGVTFLGCRVFMSRCIAASRIFISFQIRWTVKASEKVPIKLKRIAIWSSFLLSVSNSQHLVLSLVWSIHCS